MTRSPITVLWSTRDWARAIAALPVDGPLPVRTVLVPRERVAHALRRQVIDLGAGPVLAGTRFVPVAGAAAAVLDAAGVDFQPGEEARRPARLLALFRRPISLDYFRAALLTSRPGWDEAFARTLLDLEAAGLRPDDLDRDGGGPRLGDVARIWRAADAAAGRSWTVPRVLAEAAAVLERVPAAWPFPGPVLAAVGGQVSMAEARFLRALPDVTLGLLAARPTRTFHLRRVEALLGADAAAALAAARAPRSSASERDLLASFLFEPPSVLADDARPRSQGPDGSVDLEEHAGVDEELEATADWVARQILAGTPLDAIAVLVSRLDPLAGLLADRLGRLPWPEGRLPVHVAGGLPLTGTAAGARALAAVRALRAHLAGEALAGVLPALRTTGGERRHLSHGAAMDLVWSLGAVGGNPAHPEGALEWAARAAGRERELEAQLARAQQAGDDAEQAGVARRARDIERLLADLRAVRPALEALVGVARLALDGASLAALWPALREFLAGWLLQPGEGPRVHALLDERLGPLAGDETCGALAGDEALGIVEATIAGLRIPTGRFGEPAVYVGTVADAVGLPFAALRVIGLAEGDLPAVPHEDPILPDALRGALERAGVALATSRDAALGALHALDAAIRDAGTRVALSAPRVTGERSLREPSSVLLEAAAALARPDAATGERSALIPDTRALRRDAANPARLAAARFRHGTPVGQSAWQDAVARGHVTVPAGWLGLPALDIERIAAMAASAPPGPLDGLLGAACAAIPVPGLTPGWPISPSALQALLECPHRALLATLLGFEAPASAPVQREIGQPAYGALVHAVAEQFYRLHGEAFGARRGTLEPWLGAADGVADRVFDEFLLQYPLAGAAVREQQRQRVRADLRDLLEHDWTGARRFVAVERAFGWPVPLELPAGARALHVRGRIDRLDVEDGRTLVRDLKTSRLRPRTGRDAGPVAPLDVQLAVYGLAARALAPAWGLPASVAAGYVHVGRGAPGERGFRDDFHEVLEPAAAGWLEVAAGLLAARAFPRTPDPADCEWCAFTPVCGEAVYERARALLGAGDEPVRRFGALKGVEA